MVGRRCIPLVALIASLLLTGTAGTSPAAASVASRNTTWGPMQVVSRDLSNPLLASTTDGSVRGVANVGSGPTSHMAVLHRPHGGAWTARGLPIIGRPLAVADDGRTTFVLYATWTGCGIACQIRIVSVPHGGAPSASRLLDRTDADVSGSLIARDGQWWAVWQGAVKKTRNPRAEGDYGYYVHEARTLGTSYGTRSVLAGGPEVRAAQPQLVFRGRHQVLLKLDRPQHIELWVAGLPNGMLRATPHRIPSNGHDAGVPSSVTTVGTRTLVGFSRWLDRRVIIAQDNADLRFVERAIPTRSPAPYPRISASRDRVFIAYGDCSSLFDCRGLVASGALTGAFDITDVTAPLVVPEQTDRRFGIAALTAEGGKATVLFGSGTSVLYARSQR